jgi:tetratricopeptide (TPR) repeat protein
MHQKQPYICLTSFLLGIILSFFMSFNCFSQQAKVDSLLRTLSPKQDSTRVSQLLDIANFYLRTADSNQVNKYTKEALTLAKKLSYDRGEIRAYSIMSECLFKYLYWERCSIKADFALERCKTMHNVDDIKGSLLSLKGAIGLAQGNFPKATKYLNQAMKVIEMGMAHRRPNDDFLHPLYNTNKRLAYVMSMMANDGGQNAIYTKKAIDYYRKNVLLCQQNKELENRLPDAYHNLGAVYDFLNVHTDSIHYYIDKEIAIATQFGQING